MTERRLLAILGFMLALVAGLLLLIAAIHIPDRLSLEWFRDELLKLVFGLVLIVAAVIIYGGRYMAGAIIGIVVGVISLVLWRDVAVGILAIAGGLLGIFAEEV